MGAGDGDLSLAVARQVGPQGRVYASELGDDRVKTLREKIAPETLSRELKDAGFEAVSSATAQRAFMVVVAKPRQ